MGLQFTWNRRKNTKVDHPRCAVIIPAAGSASRMEGTDKILAVMGDKPVIIHTLLAFQQCPYVDELIVVTREDLMPAITGLADQWKITKPLKIVKGGSSRAESVSLGLAQVGAECGLVAVHDGARPFVSQSVLQEVFTKAVKAGAAAPAIAVKDTVKRVDHQNVVEETVDREPLRAVQTPQVFDADLFKAAMQQAMEQALPITDDCSAVEAMGKKVLLTTGSEENIKITTPTDLIFGEAILKCRAQ